jgi:citrate synthase
MSQDDNIRLHRGLREIYFDRTETTFIDGGEGVLEYRGYSIHDLAEESNFEETSYLLLHGDLPTREQLDAFDAELRGCRELPAEIFPIIEAVKDSHPMDVLRTAVSALSAFDPDKNAVWDDVDATFRKGLRMTAQVPTIVAAHYNIRRGKEVVAPRRDLGHAANFLYMLDGELPSEETAELMDKDLVLHADHGSNASSFTARVVAGTKADAYSAVSAAIGALSGPSHGGAAENVMQMAREIGSPGNAASYVRNLLKSRTPVMGFGHRVYKSADPRAKHLREGVRRLSEEKGQPEWYEILTAVQEAMSPYARRGVHANVDFFAGVIYYLNGVPQDLFVPIFAIGRVPGWIIQIVEQYRRNILIRPLLKYTGDREREYVPISERG